MTKVTITAEQPGSPDTLFRASTQQRESVGRTPGAALDALTAQLGNTRSGAMIVVQDLRGDEFFTDAQRSRLEALLIKWREARQSGKRMTAEDEAELQALVDAELDGSGRRAAAMVSELAK